MVNCFIKNITLVVIVMSQACSVQPTEKTAAGSAQVSRPLIFEGRATITNDSFLLARRQALQDAIQKASSFVVKSGGQTMINQNGVQPAGVLVGNREASNVQVLSERVVAGVLVVRAKIALAADGVCMPHLRKRLIATAFPLSDPGHMGSAETQDLYSGIPREINNLLVQSADFIGQDATQTSLYDQPELAPQLPVSDSYQPSSVIQLAEKQGAQLVLSGVIRDMQIEAGDYIRGSGPLGIAKSVLRDVWSRRGIGVDVYVHDGFTGALLMQSRYTDTAEGDVWIPNGYAVGSARFNATTTGGKIAKLIEQASADIQHSLSCYPFATRIIKREGETLFIDAGGQDNLRAGDQLVIYTDTSEDLAIAGGSRYVGNDKSPVGILTLSEIRPRYASGQLDIPPDKVGVRVGDWAKSW